MFSVLYYVEVFLHLQGLPMAGELAYILTTYAVCGLNSPLCHSERPFGTYPRT